MKNYMQSFTLTLLLKYFFQSKGNNYSYRVIFP